MNTDSIFGIHEQALKLRAHRGEILANNLANADTPNFKARDIDFKSALNAYESKMQVKLETSNRDHMTLSSNNNLSPSLQYRTPLQNSMDGNTVDEHQEKVAYAKNANEYLVSLKFLNGRIKGLMSAIKGE